MKSTCPQSLDPKYFAVLNILKSFYPKKCCIKFLLILGISCLCFFPSQLNCYLSTDRNKYLFSDCLDVIFKTLTHSLSILEQISKSVLGIYHKSHPMYSQELFVVCSACSPRPHLWFMNIFHDIATDSHTVFPRYDFSSLHQSFHHFYFFHPLSLNLQFLWGKRCFLFDYTLSILT